jgi:hypothetical protein
MLTHIIDGTTEAGKQYPVQPNHICTGDHFWEAFGNLETETSARHIVRLCQARGGWLAFTKEEIDTFSGHNFWFNRLHVPGRDKDEYNVVRLVDGKYYVTHEFITTCFKSSPAPDLIPAQETAGYEG